MRRNKAKETKKKEAGWKQKNQESMDPEIGSRKVRVLPLSCKQVDWGHKKVLFLLLLNFSKIGRRVICQEWGWDKDSWGLEKEKAQNSSLVEWASAEQKIAGGRKGMLKIRITYGEWHDTTWFCVFLQPHPDASVQVRGSQGAWLTQGLGFPKWLWQIRRELRVCAKHT